MTTTTNYSLDRDTLIRAGCDIAGLATEGEPIEPEMLTVLARQLNIHLKHLTTKGFRLWKRQRQSITLVASQNTYTLSQKTAGTTTSTSASKLVDTSANFVVDVAVGDTIYNTTDSTNTTISAIDSTTQLSVADDIFASGENYEITSSNVSFPRPERIIECNRKTISDGNETTITPLSLQEYETLPNKTDTGTPVQYFYDPELTQGKLYLWLTPDATAVSTYTVELVALTQVNDMDNSTDTFDFPQYWYQPIVDKLAYVASKIYGSARLGELQILRDDASMSENDAINYDQEDSSVFFQPDIRGY